MSTPSLPPLKWYGQYAKISPAEEKELAHTMGTHYDHGASIRDIVNTTGISYTKVRKLLQSCGTKMRSPNRKTRPKTTQRQNYERSNPPGEN